MIMKMIIFSISSENDDYNSNINNDDDNEVDNNHNR